MKVWRPEQEGEARLRLLSLLKCLGLKCKCELVLCEGEPEECVIIQPSHVNTALPTGALQSHHGFFSYSVTKHPCLADTEAGARATLGESSQTLMLSEWVNPGKLREDGLLPFV